MYGRIKEDDVLRILGLIEQVIKNKAKKSLVFSDLSYFNKHASDLFLLSLELTKKYNKTE